MKTLIRVNGEIKEDTEITLDSEMGLLTLNRGFASIVRVKDKGTFAEINIYGSFGVKDSENVGQ